MNGNAAATMPATPDRRRHHRFRLSVPISVSGSDSSVIPAITLEISEAGLSAVLVSDLHIGDFVKIYPIAGETFAAHVRHRVGRVSGFEFLNPSELQVSRLREICTRLPRYPESNKMGI